MPALPNGDPGIKYTPPGGSLTTHTLRWPMHRVPGGRPLMNMQRRYASDSLDYSTHDVVIIGSGVEEAVVAIRFDNQPTSLRTMLRHGLNGVSLAYFPSLASAGTSYPLILLAIEGASGPDETLIVPDRDRMAFGEYEAVLRVRGWPSALA